MGSIYLIHFDTPICEGHPCQHYIGWTNNTKGGMTYAHAHPDHQR